MEATGVPLSRGVQPLLYFQSLIKYLYRYVFQHIKYYFAMELFYERTGLKKLILYLRQREYQILFLSFMLLIFGDTFNNTWLLVSGLIFQNMLVGLFIFYQKKWLRISILVLIAACIVISVIGARTAIFDSRILEGMTYLVFFALVSIEVFREVLYSKTVSTELLAAALCGFLLLCMVGAILFVQINLLLPQSFLNAGDDLAMSSNLTYFSFTTMLTIGYGDIVPLTLIAKRGVMLMGLLGHFYTVFITSIIIGKYLSFRTAKP
jgi:hypothetical protein